MIDNISQRAVVIRDHIALRSVAGTFLDGFGAFRGVLVGFERRLIDGFVDQFAGKVGARGCDRFGGGRRFGFFRIGRCVCGHGRGLLGGQVGLRRAGFKCLRGGPGL